MRASNVMHLSIAGYLVFESGDPFIEATILMLNRCHITSYAFSLDRLRLFNSIYGFGVKSHISCRTAQQKHFYAMNAQSPRL